MRNLGYQMLAVIGLLLLWQGLALMGLWPPYLFPAPADVAATLGRVGTNGELATALLVTVRRIFLGYGSATVLGLGLVLVRPALERPARARSARGRVCFRTMCSSEDFLR